ncbi:DoxX family membrane protein [Yangia mangrovi]|uniref:DoxX family membrane protein n=1 Tax=Alloyangia mangrovi TaxID=1779329 RepID=A0A2A3JZ94_9RHOB|nr:DoxX family membrane protein [Alloyangia mangrovi]MCT4371343.1 DoxX family membrane protein [Alloyangia mangrovi]
MTDLAPSAASTTALLAQLDRAERAVTRCAPAVLGLTGRVVFAATLAGFFWTSALTKIDGFGLSLNAYAQIFPRAMEAVGYDASQLGLFAHLVVAAGTAAEVLLPLLLILGLFTRLGALGMIGLLLVVSLTDIFGHGVDATAIGALFDRQPDAPILDQRLLWGFLMLVLVFTGGGALSLDRWLRRRLRD